MQSALLEAMQERQVTIGGETFPLERPFLVLATQNPIEQEGTYPLPEAQVDRFMLKLLVDYPAAPEERQILDRMATHRSAPAVEPVMEPERIFSARKVLDEIYMDDKIKDYIVALVQATRRRRISSSRSPSGSSTALRRAPRSIWRWARGPWPFWPAAAT